MLCPNCGTTTTTEHRFCRHCGMNLAPVSKALAAHLAQGGVAAAPPAAEGSGRSDLRRMANGLAAGVGILLLGVLLLSLSRIFMLRPSYKLFSVVALCLGTFVSLLAVLSPLRSMGRRRGGDPPEGLKTTPTGRLLHESTFEPVPRSVTDHTTDLLGVEIPDRKSHV